VLRKGGPAWVLCHSDGRKQAVLARVGGVLGLGTCRTSLRRVKLEPKAGSNPQASSVWLTECWKLFELAANTQKPENFI
jgi:hypothetical protein